MKNENYIVVLGVSGGLGAAVARELVKQNKKVIGINRSGKTHPMMVPEEVDVRGIDIYDTEQLLPILEGAELIYHCINLPYSKWKSHLLDLTKHIVGMVEQVNVPLVISDNLYMYHEIPAKTRSEDMPYDSQIGKGKVRAAVANYYRQAHDDGRIKMVMVRGPSYYGAGSLDTSHYGDRLFTKILAGRKAMFVGDPTIDHTTIHVGDFARAMILLGNDEEAYGQAWHAPCPPPMKKEDFSNLAYELADFDPIKPGSFQKLLLSFAGLFDKNIAEVREMLYEFNQPYYVDHSKFMTRYPDFEITPIKDGIIEAIGWYKQYLGLLEVVAK